MDISKFALSHFRSEGFLTISKVLISEFGLIKAAILSNYLDKYAYWENRRGDKFTGWFFLRYKDQIHQLGGDFKETALRNYRNYFIDKGILISKTEGLPSKTYYTIDFHVLLSTVYGEDLYLGFQGASQLHSKGHYIYKKNINLRKNYNKKFKRGNGEITKSKFDQFWNIYPNKSDKGKALTKWNQLCVQKERPKLDTLLQAIEEQKTTKRWKNGFIPMPTTWLNQSRWLDDIAPMNEEYDKPSKPTKVDSYGATMKFGQNKIVI